MSARSYLPKWDFLQTFKSLVFVSSFLLYHSLLPMTASTLTIALVFPIVLYSYDDRIKIASWSGNSFTIPWEVGRLSNLEFLKICMSNVYCCGVILKLASWLSFVHSSHLLWFVQHRAKIWKVPYRHNWDN